MNVIRRVLSIGCIATGIALLAYPFVMSQLDKLNQANLIGEYDSYISSLSDSDKEALRSKAAEYNNNLRISGLGSDNVDVFSVKGFLGYIDIPKISVFLPIYSGTSEYVLQNGVGHIDKTSLPYGGKGTHCVLTGHTGLPESELFTNISSLVEGDIFYIHVLDEVLAYEVDNIKVVLPYEVDDLKIFDNEDYVTLVTCTPYGINTHRLLVRGKRVAYTPSNYNEILDATNNQKTINQEPVSVSEYKDSVIKSYIVIAIIFLIVVAVFVIVDLLLIRYRKKRLVETFEKE